MNLPNKLTISRLILVIPFIVCLSISISFTDQNLNYSELNMKTTFFIVSSIIFIVAMFTDFLDGYLARKWNQVSTFGKLFDPLADKFITSSALIFLVAFKLTPIYFVVIFILRDILVDGGRNLAASKNMKIAASWLGKIKTILQSIGIPLIMFVAPILNLQNGDIFSNYLNASWELWTLNTIIILALVFSVISGIDYMHKIFPLIKEGNHG